MIEEDEEMKRRYRNLRSNVYAIRNKINNLSDEYNNMKINIKNSVSVDGETPGMDEIENVKNDMDNIICEINNNLLPKINRNT